MRDRDGCEHLVDVFMKRLTEYLTRMKVSLQDGTPTAVRLYALVLYVDLHSIYQVRDTLLLPLRAPRSYQRRRKNVEGLGDLVLPKTGYYDTIKICLIVFIPSQ